ncbi:unnamed protein product [Adineta steineri]|uniref:G-protein coupled receptors family 1 profile domain-containing protein n=1 Tax=Adineta steineri TaxID=433720 RepID=A0A813MQ69_9BILA|nr:unnamed protein product [Adineta steineri]CAF4162952.1 unnamed protein product [Adineta steineri]
MPSSSQKNPSLALATYILTYYGYSFMLILGNIGNVCNIVLFLQKKLRTTSCNNFTAFTNLIALNVGISTLINAEARPSEISAAYCKIEGYIMNICLQISRYLIVCACFDRYALCSTDARLRKFSRVYIARRYVIPSVIFIWFIIPMHVPILINVQNSTCSFVDIGALYNSIYGILLIGIIPPGLMFIFSLLTFRNLKLRQQRRQIHPVASNNAVLTIRETQRLKVKDQQVFAMLLIQVFAYVASSTPYTIIVLYVVLTTVKNIDVPTADKSSLTFILFVTDMFRFICPFMSFYLFLLVSRLYRFEMVSIIRKIYNRCNILRKRNNDNNNNRHNTVCIQNSNYATQTISRRQQNQAPVALSMIAT